MEVVYDADDVKRVFAAYPVAAARALNDLIKRGAIAVQREMKLNAPTHDGALRSSIKYVTRPSQIEAEIGPNVPYAAAVEKGSKPHWTSVKEGTPLRKWADDHGISPYAVQWSIAQKGTKANPFVQYTRDSMQYQVPRDIEVGFGRFVQKVNDGQI